MVSSFVSLLSKKYASELDDEAQKYINYAVDGSTRMQEMIKSLLNYSRLNTRSFDKEEVDLNEVIKKVQLDLSAKIAETETKIQFPKLPSVEGNSIQLQQLLMNLIENGIKYRSNAVPRIEITLKEYKEHYQFCVKDNGIGISPEYHEKVFVIFQRLHTRQDYPGTGIGLAVCARIIHNHKGKIWVESKEGYGSKFYFTLKKPK